MTTNRKAAPAGTGAASNNAVNVFHSTAKANAREWNLQLIDYLSEEFEQQALRSSITNQLLTKLLAQERKRLNPNREHTTAINRLAAAIEKSSSHVDALKNLGGFHD